MSAYLCTKRGITAILCAALLYVPAARAADKIVLGFVGGTPAFYWPHEIAQAKGMFAAEGLTIDVVYIPSSTNIVLQLTAGSLNMGVPGMVDPIRAIEKGAPIATVRIEGSVPPHLLFANPKIKEIADLKGKTVMVGGSADITRIYAERMLSAHGVQPGQFDMMFAGTSEARFAGLVSGSADAAILGSPFDGRAAAAGYTNLGVAMDYVKDLPFTGYVANRAWANTQGTAVRKFLAAYQKAVDWFYDNKNRDEAVEILVTRTRSNPADDAKTYDFLRQIEFFERSGKVSLSKLESLVNALRQLGQIQRSLDPDALVIRGLTPLE